MEAAGLPGEWWKQNSDDPTYCLTKIQRKMKEKTGKKRLNLNNLSGAFFVVAIGYVISIIAFIFEHGETRRRRPRIGNLLSNNQKPTHIISTDDNIINATKARDYILKEI